MINITVGTWLIRRPIDLRVDWLTWEQVMRTAGALDNEAIFGPDSLVNYPGGNATEDDTLAGTAG